MKMAFSNKSGGSDPIPDSGESKTHIISQDCRVFFGSDQALLFPDRDHLTECCVSAAQLPDRQGPCPPAERQRDGHTVHPGGITGRPVPVWHLPGPPSLRASPPGGRLNQPPPPRWTPLQQGLRPRNSPSAGGRAPTPCSSLFRRPPDDLRRPPRCTRRRDRGGTRVRRWARTSCHPSPPPSLRGANPLPPPSVDRLRSPASATTPASLSPPAAARGSLTLGSPPRAARLMFGSSPAPPSPPGPRQSPPSSPLGAGRPTVASTAACTGAPGHHAPTPAGPRLVPPPSAGCPGSAGESRDRSGTEWATRSVLSPSWAGAAVGHDPRAPLPRVPPLAVLIGAAAKSSTPPPSSPALPPPPRRRTRRARRTTDVAFLPPLPDTNTSLSGRGLRSPPKAAKGHTTAVGPA